MSQPNHPQRTVKPPTVVYTTVAKSVKVYTSSFLTHLMASHAVSGPASLVYKQMSLKTVMVLAD